MRIFLTGGTGFLGSYIAERAVEAGDQITALARPSSNTALLESLGANLVRGDLADVNVLRSGAERCDVVIHAAAKVMDWGTWEEYYEETVTATANIYDAAVAAGVPRAVHVSSVAVYDKESVLAGDVDESKGPVQEEKLPRWYFYGRAKSLAEIRAMEYHTSGKIAMSVIRPAWLIGARDMRGLPRFLANLEKGRLPIFGNGANELNATYAGNVADAIMLAAKRDEAVGEAFNVANDYHVTQRQFMNTMAEAIGCKPPSIVIPYPIAMAIGGTLEAVHHGLKLPRRPMLTRHGVQLVALPSRYPTTKIRERLGFEPRVDFETVVAGIKEWWAVEGPRLRGSL